MELMASWFIRLIEILSASIKRLLTELIFYLNPAFELQSIMTAYSRNFHFYFLDNLFIDALYSDWALT